MNIQSKSPRSSINWKQISIIAIVLGVSAFQYINSRKDAANQNTAQSGGTAQLDSPEDIDLDGALRDSNKVNSQPDLKFKPPQASEAKRYLPLV